MSFCIECRCKKETGKYKYSWHFAHCSKVQRAKDGNVCWTIITKIPQKTDACLDEVYLCRYDCIPMLREAA